MLKTFGVILLCLLILAGLIFGRLYLLPPEEAGVRKISADANGMVTDHAKGIKNLLGRDQSHKKVVGGVEIIDVQAYRTRTTPRSQDVAQARLARDEQIAISMGLTLPRPVRKLPANQYEWVETDIPVYSCTKIVVTSGTATRGDQTSTADGLSVDTTGKTTYLGLPWGTFAGKVCDPQKKQADCGPVIKLGSAKELRADYVSAGRLWIKFVGYESKSETDPVQTDYTDYTGGYYFDQAKCDALAEPQ